MKCYKSVQNVQPSGNIEMMYSELAIPAQSAPPHHITAHRLGLIWKKKKTNIICFYFFFAVDIEING